MADDLIELRNVYKRLGTKQILDGIDLTIKRGETLVIIGRSGIGKSVTLRHIVGLMKPDQGDVLVDHRSVPQMAEWEIYEMRKRFGMLHQNGALIRSMTVGENVALPLREHDPHLTEDEIWPRVKKTLALVHLHDVEEMMPTILSGGMRNRVGLARAIIRNPEIILYDEPTTGLDPIMANAINELIVDLKNKFGVTSLVITHDMPGAFRIADRIAMLSKGKIIKIGSPQDFLETEDPVVKQFVFGEDEPQEGPMPIPESSI